MNVEPWLGPILSAVIVGASSVLSMRVMLGRLEERLESLKQGNIERGNENARRFDRLEHAVGITNGDHAVFVSRRECFLMEGTVKEKLETISKRIDAVETDLKRLLAQGGEHEPN